VKGIQKARKSFGVGRSRAMGNTPVYLIKRRYQIRALWQGAAR